MRIPREEPSYVVDQVIDLISAVKELHGLTSQEFSKLIKDSFTVEFNTEKGSTIKIDVEKLACFLPLHLMAVLISSDTDELLLRYTLCGVRLLHSLCDLSSRNSKLEQILLDDVKVSEQLLDLISYIVIVLSRCRQESSNASDVSLVHPALVSCTLYLLTACISSQWQELVQVLVAHPKVDVFTDAAFGAVHVAIKFLQVKMLDHRATSSTVAEPVINYLCQQCEASLQFLHSLCHQKLFRERLLKNKELCGRGGILFLAQAILKLNVTPAYLESSRVVASISRMRAKTLSILLLLCEAESVSYLDEVASSPESFDLAKSIVLEVLELLKFAANKDPGQPGSHLDRTIPRGLLRLNSMRLADIFSDDSNFRSYVTTCFTRVLTAMFSLPHGEFLSVWCSSEIPPREEDATLEYDAFAAAGWVLDAFSSLNLPNGTSTDFNLIPITMPQAAYAHQRTSLFVKVIANLHCFVPNICEEQERNLFLHKFLECMRINPSISLPGYSFTSGTPKAAAVCRNLSSLLSHAESLIPNFLNEEDVQLLRVFSNQLQSQLNSADLEGNLIHDINTEGSVSLDKFSKLTINGSHQEAISTRRCSSSLLTKKEQASSINSRITNHKEEISESSAVQEEEPSVVRHEGINGEDVMMIDDKDKSVIVKEVGKDVHNIEGSGSDTSSTRRKKGSRIMNNDNTKASEQIKESGPDVTQEDEKAQQPRKRKRNIMNEYQISLIEEALIDEPEMQRNAASIQSWAEKLSSHGSEVTASQLKNWINNRKARLARAGKDTRASMEVDNTTPEKPAGAALIPSRDSPESANAGKDSTPPSTKDTQSKLRSGENSDADPPESSHCKPFEVVVLLNEKGDVIGKGRVHQVQGDWSGKSLEESGTYVVDVIDLKVDDQERLPYPSETTGSSFHEAKAKIGLMRVLWDAKRVFALRRPRPLTQ